jgi:hypothetical protein
VRPDRGPRGCSGGKTLQNQLIGDEKMTNTMQKFRDIEAGIAAALDEGPAQRAQC